MCEVRKRGWLVSFLVKRPVGQQWVARLREREITARSFEELCDKIDADFYGAPGYNRTIEVKE